MKLNHSALILAFAIVSTFAFAQRTNPVILLRNGPVQIPNNIRQDVIDSFNHSVIRINDKAYAVIQFETIPKQGDIKNLYASGIQLLEYLPINAYTVSISGPLKLDLLKSVNASALFKLNSTQKTDVHLMGGNIPSWATKVVGTADVWISYSRAFSAREVTDHLHLLNFDIISTLYEKYRVIALRVAISRIAELADLPYVEFVQAAPPADQPLNFNSRNVSRAGFLNASVANGGKGLNGEGVTVGIGDNADVQTHVDFSGRLVNRTVAGFAAHGHHTTGTLAGAGNINELYRGYAPKSTIVSQSFNGILNFAPTYVQDYGMIVTNNSYGNVVACDYHGTYDLYSRILDQMAFELPHLVNVFAAGNSGNSTCAPFSTGFRTVLGGYQTAKNVLTVGATNDSGLIAFFSSRGPVKDGRTKPDIMTMGQTLVSAWPINTYSYDQGTSMAAPGAAGGLALLYQRYRQLNGGADPLNGLMKAILCNGAIDKGNPGPDYYYGYGWMNLLRSVDMIEKNHYFISTISNGAVKAYTVNIPSNTAQLKVMLYWNDPAASLLSSQSLVNDLDLQVTDPTLSTTLPFILDSAVSNVGNAASRGVDRMNNMEQVVINNPPAGSYNIKVAGTAIALNPSQDYFIAYDIIPVQVKITAPAGGDDLVPSTGASDLTKISWDAFGFSSGTATLEFSADNGATWSTIATGVDINRSVYSWYVPGTVTSQAQIRITKDITGESSTTNPFTILPAPTVSLAPVQCEGYINISWTAVAGATDYEIMMLRGDDMKPLAYVTGTSYTINGLSKDTTYWVTVRARINGKPGRRAVAISALPNIGNCSGSISDNDLKLDAILSPLSGRIYTSTALTSSSAVTVRIKNLDDAPISNFSAAYSINGGSWVTENITATIGPGATYTHTFGSTVDLSSPGQYILKTAVTNITPDPVSANDTAVLIFKQLDNQPLDLTSFFLDDIENAAAASYTTNAIGITGLDRYDFTQSTIYGRLQTFINSGIAYSGSKALTLDDSRYDPAGNTDFLTGTYNLSNYSASLNDIRLDFEFNNHGQVANSNNRVWIRGSDSQPWVLAYNLDDNENSPGIYKKTRSIEITRLLNGAGQDFSPSFQVKWGQFGQLPATDLTDGAGYSFDNIRIYQVFNDIQMISIDSPLATSCNLTSTSGIKISVRNSASNSISNIPVKYRINNGSWVSDTIPVIPANTTMQFNFIMPADLSAIGQYTIQVIADYPSDNFRENDTAEFIVINSPLINSFPYLQNFESGYGNWYSQGTNNSWEYGTPNSSKINRAASGAKAWKTRLVGNYNDNETSYLYSPCFDISSMNNPTLSFSVALDLEDCGGTLCDGAWVEYSADGITWKKIGAFGNGTNWYNKATDQLWSVQGYTRWHVATYSLPKNLIQMHIRFVLQSDPATNHEGIAIDDIHIYDNLYGIYDSSTINTPIVQNVSGNNWTNFLSQGKLVASVQPYNQNLGQTAVQAYINNSGVRHTTNQYYHDRNITIKPSTRPDSATVRFYFLDKESDSLIFAAGCGGCSKPSSAYELGISKYDDPDTSFENGSIADDNQGMWTYINSDQVIKVPFDKGYYAEFKVSGFSEFWLNNGGLSGSLPLPVKMMNFTAQKQNLNVLLQWSVASENNVRQYDIELARGIQEMQTGNFSNIGSVPGKGNSPGLQNYSFNDKEPDKFGSRFYRLKVINQDGSFFFSPVRQVIFDEPVLWSIYPNPSQGLFYLVYQLNSSETLNGRIVDSKGSLIQEYQLKGNGFPQKLVIDLSNEAGGVYLLQINSPGKKQNFKLYKQ